MEDRRDRAQELNDLVEKALADNPQLRESLELYQLGRDEYYKALASTRVITITSDDNTVLGGNLDGELDRD